MGNPCCRCGVAASRKRVASFRGWVVTIGLFGSTPIFLVNDRGPGCNAGDMSVRGNFIFLLSWVGGRFGPWTRVSWYQRTLLSSVHSCGRGPFMVDNLVVPGLIVVSAQLLAQFIHGLNCNCVCSCMV